MCIIGTRPEAIKMAPVVLALRDESSLDVRVVATSQHRQMLDQVLECFGIMPDVDLDVMRLDQGLTDLTARLLVRLGEMLDFERPDAVLIQGDTTTVMATALACYYSKIPFGHVEAGLRTGDLDNPFPEEANRVIAGNLARWHFAPTEGARQNLLGAGIDDCSIFVTGNTVIDALFEIVDRTTEIGIDLDPRRRLVLVTAHRRENFGAPFLSICNAIGRLAALYPDTMFLYPVHPNPNVRDVAHRVLGGRENIHLCEPLDYAPFVAAMQRAHVILTDSGGVQEEAPALGKPVLVMRSETERPEAVEQGVVRLVGTDADIIVNEAQRLLDDEAAWRRMARGVSPYGDGKAASRIVGHLRDYFGQRSE